MRIHVVWRPILWTAVFGFAGVQHFRKPEVFDSIVPPELPGSARTYTLASGAMEIALAAGIAIPATRSTAARLAQAFLLGVWPGNIYMVKTWWEKPWPWRLGALARVPLQIPMFFSVGKLANR